MSGICGILSFDGSEPQLGPILALLERRGPDGTHQSAEGPVALGHTLLATTPEALVEELPLTEPDSGCTITADARLDNREELIAALDLGGETRTIGDGELILRAYLLWGEECPTHLLGDFAFAIWDPRAERLFCARDHMGMRQLIYHHAPGRLLAFATEAEALVAHPDVPKRINEARIADFLDDLEGIDFTSTFFEEVFRLPPAHRLTVDSNGLALSRYWQLTPGPELKLNSDQAYADAFLEVFTEAVRCRLRSAGPVGSMLSGGIDSNSVAAVAAEILTAEGRGPLLTFSGVGPDADNCAETAAIQHARLNKNFRSATISYEKFGPLLNDLEQLTLENAEPFDRHMTMHRAILLLAKQQGVTALLDGAAGDLILTTTNRLVPHLNRLDFRSAWREARGEETFWKAPGYAYRALAGAAWRAFVPRHIRHLKRQIGWQLKAIRPEKTISKALAKTARLKDRRQQFRSHECPDHCPSAIQRASAIRHPNLTAGRERYDRVAGQLGIEQRDPYMDIRLVAFCLSLPEPQLQRDGWPKWILRRAMNGRVPSAVGWRSGKEHLGWNFSDAVLKLRFMSRLRFGSGTLLRRYIKAAEQLEADAASGGDLSEPYKEAFFLDMFLSRHARASRSLDKQNQQAL